MSYLNFNYYRIYNTYNMKFKGYTIILKLGYLSYTIMNAIFTYLRWAGHDKFKPYSRIH